MNISSNYGYSNQAYSTESLLRLLQKRNAEGTSSEQGLLQALGNTSQATAAQKPASPLAELVSDGTITPEQEQAIKDALDAARMAFQTKPGAENASGNSAFTDPLANLVSAGTITEDQKTAVKSAFESARSSQGMQGMQGMRPPPPPPPQSSGDGDPKGLSSILDSLVADGILTDEQGDSVLSALVSAFQLNTTGSSGSGTSTTDNSGAGSSATDLLWAGSSASDGNGIDPLDNLVTAGTITEDQKDQIQNAFEEAMSTQRMPPPPPPTEMSQDDSTDALSSALDELVKSGTITSDQQQALSSIYQSAISAYSAQSNPYAALLSNSYEIGA